MGSGFELNFATDSLIVMGIVLLLTTTVPIKIGAGFVGATKTSFNASGSAALLGLLTAYLSFSLVGGFLGLIVAYVSMSLAYWFVLKPTFIGSFGLTILVLIIQVAIIQAMVNYGVISS